MDDANAVIKSLVDRLDLSGERMTALMESILAGQLGEAETAGFLVALRCKGETAQEIAAAARVLRRHMLAWDPGRPDVLDTCGTGGDGLGAFNISTAAALVVAGAGVAVVKHGNRAVSSQSGSADVLGALGVRIDGDGYRARQSLDRAGLAFCFAPQFHPALKHVGPVRRKLGIATIFNCLGPLANPAGANRQLLGVGRSDLLDRMADALALLGTKHALVVCSRDGLDEVSLSAPTQVREIEGNEIRTHEWTPADFDLPACTLSELAAADAQASARIIEEVLAGKAGAAFNMVLANAAAAFMAADRVANLREGVELARRAIVDGKARLVLEQLRW